MTRADDIRETLAFMREKWIPVLRSKKYLQGRGFLRSRSSTQRKPRYCCLGVGLDLGGVEWREDKGAFAGPGEAWGTPDVGSDEVTEIKDDRSWPMPAFGVELLEEAAERNDGSGFATHGFRGIARWLEREIVPELESELEELSQ